MRGVASIFAVVLACACSKAPSSTTPAREKPITTAELWALAPEGIDVGIVYGPGQGALLQRAMNEVIASLRSTNVKIAALEKMVRDVAALKLSNGRVPGYDLDSATAVFFRTAGEEVYSVYRVTDRAAMRAALEGVTDGDVDVFEYGGRRSVCEPKGELYHCAPNVDALKAWTPGATPFGQDWPADLRGPMELLAKIEGTPQSPAATIYARGRAERGRGSMDFVIRGLPAQSLAPAPAPLAKARLARPRNGHLQINPALVKLALSQIPAEVLDTPLPGGVTANAVVSALTGEVVLSVHSGGGELAIGVDDPGPFRALLPVCDMPLPLTVRRDGDACLVDAPLPTGERLRARLRVTDAAVVASFGAAPGEATAPAAAPTRLEEPWLVAGWLRGVGNNVSTLAPLAAHLDARAMTLIRWAVAHLSEISFGFRYAGDEGRGFLEVATSWRNPPEVVARLEPLLARVSRGELGALGGIDRLAAAHPRSPLAIDRSLGDHRPLFAPAGLAVFKAMKAAIEEQETARNVVDEFNGLRAKMCDCDDRACAESVNAEFEAWLARNQHVKGSLKLQERAKEIARDYTECMMEVFKNQPSAPSPP